MTERRIALFDLDGTLALIEHRFPLIECKPRQWDAFFAACVHDAPNWPLIFIARALSQAGFEVIIATGRSDAVRGQTEGWLGRHDVPFEQLLMRAQGDHQPDHRLKRGWIASGRIDRERVAMFDGRQTSRPGTIAQTGAARHRSPASL